MKLIRRRQHKSQTVLQVLTGVLTLVTAALAARAFPDLRRYLRMRSM